MPLDLRQNSPSSEKIIKVTDLLTLTHNYHLGLAIVDPIAKELTSVRILGNTFDDPKSSTPMPPPQRCPARTLNPGRLGSVLETLAVDWIGLPIPASSRCHRP